MTYQFHFTKAVLGKLDGFPQDAMDVLVSTLAVVLENPYDVLHSRPRGSDQRERMAEHDDDGFIYLDVDDAARLIIVTELVWTG